MFQNNKEVYSLKEERVELDKAKMAEIESRIIKSVMIGEKAEITVKANYMVDRNSELLSVNGLSPNTDCVFICEVHDIEIWDYVRRPAVDTVNKTRELRIGVGDDMPDRESFVKIKIRIDDLDSGKTLINTFFKEDIYEHAREDTEFAEWNKRMEPHMENRQKSREADEKMFEECDLFGVRRVDMKEYNIPILLRKTIIHMRRGQVNVVLANFIDVFDIDGVKIDWGKGKFRIFVELFDFFKRSSFTVMSTEQKLTDLKKMKEIADSSFKNKRLVRASKIYHNINYRFNYGDVFESEEHEKKEKEKIPEIWEELIKIRKGSHLNLASAKFRLKQYSASRDAASKVITDFDSNNEKGLYLLGKSCVELKEFGRALESFEKLAEINPNQAQELDIARQLAMKEEKKRKNLFKKMLFAEDN